MRVVAYKKGQNQRRNYRRQYVKIRGEDQDVRGCIEITRGKAKKQGEQSRKPKTLGSDGNWVRRGPSVRAKASFFPFNPRAYSTFVTRCIQMPKSMLLRLGMRQRTRVAMPPNPIFVYPSPPPKHTLHVRSVSDITKLHSRF